MGHTMRAFLFILLVSLTCVQGSSVVFIKKKDAPDIKVKFASVGYYHPFSFTIDANTETIIDKVNISEKHNRIVIPVKSNVSLYIHDPVEKYFQTKSCKIHVNNNVASCSEDNGGAGGKGGNKKSSGEQSGSTQCCRQPLQFSTSGNTTLTVKYGKSVNINLQLFILVEEPSVPIKPSVPSVSIEPSAIVNCSKYELLKDTVVFFNIQNAEESSKLQMTIDGVIKDIQQKFNRSFTEVGTFSVSIYQSFLLIWQLEITVVEINLQDLVPGLNLATNEVLNINLEKRCVLTNANSLHWIYEVKGKETKYSGPSFKHTFDKIGETSVNSKLRLMYPAKNSLAKEIYIQLYDFIEGFTMIRNKTIICPGDTLKVTFSIQYGSAVIYKYNLIGESPETVDTDIVTLNTEVGTYEFMAKNPVSESKKKLIIEPLNYLNVNVTFKKDLLFLTNHTVTITPKNMTGLTCSYRCQWSINSSITKEGLITDPSVYPVFDHVFIAEGIYIVTFSIDSTTFNTSINVEIQNEISFELVNQLVTMVGKNITITPNFILKSAIFDYKWSSDYAIPSSDKWFRNVNSVLSLNLQIAESDNFYVNLTVENKVSSITKKVNIVIADKRTISFEFYPPQGKCMNKESSLITVTLLDNEPQGSYQLTCDVNQQVLTQDEITNITSDSFNLHVDFQTSGNLTLTCKLTDTQFTGSVFYYVLLESLNASISPFDFVAGDVVEGEILQPIQGIPYIWYIRNQNKWQKLSSGVKVSHLLDEPGIFFLAVTVNELILSCSKKWRLPVEIPLTIKIDGFTLSTYTQFITTNSNKSFTAHVGNAKGTFTYEWTNSKINSQIISTSNEYKFHANEQGIVILSAKVSINGISQSLNVTLHIQSSLTDVNLISSKFGDLSINGVIPAGVESLDVTVYPVPLNTISVSSTIYCTLLHPAKSIFTTKTPKNNFNIPLEPGESKCIVEARNSVSTRNKEITFFVKTHRIPSVTFLEPTHPPKPGDIALITVQIKDNTLPSNLTWFYENEKITKCSTNIQISSAIGASYQTSQCNITITDTSTTLKVLLQSANPNGYNVTMSINSVQVTSSMSPRVIQVSLPTNITIASVSGNQLRYKWLYKGSKENFLSYIKITEENIGKYVLNVVVYNVISSQFIEEIISAIDAGDFNITSNQGEILGSQVSLFLESTINLKILTNHIDVRFVWDVFPNNELTIEGHNDRHKFVKLPNTTLLSYYNVTVTSSLNNVFVKVKYVILKVQHRKISNVTISTPSSILPLNKTYSIDVFWLGKGGICQVVSFSLSNCLKHHAVVQYQMFFFPNNCTIQIRTDSQYKCYFLLINVANVGSNEKQEWTYKPFLQIPIEIELEKHLQHSKRTRMSIKNPIPLVQYKWFLGNLTTLDSSKLSIGNGPVINFTVPDSLQYGEYQVKVVSSFQGDIREANSSLLITPNSKKKLNSSLEVNTKSEEYVDIYLNAKTFLAGLTYTWSVCLKGSGNNCTGNATVIGFERTITYQFLKSFKEGIYLFTVVGTGMSTQVTILEHICYHFCFPHNLRIEPLDSQDGLSRYRSHVMSNWFYGEVKIETSCKLKYEWKFKCTHPDQKGCTSSPWYQPQLLPGMSLVNDGPLLELPPRSFQVGEYEIHLLITMGEFLPQVKIVVVHLKVGGSPLIPVIAGGEQRVIGDQNDAFLDATETIDPDATYGNPANLTFKWEIPKIQCYIPVTNRNASINEWSEHNKRLEIKKECLKPHEDSAPPYLHVLYARRNDRKENGTRTSIQKIYVVKGKAPLVEIECITCQAYKTFKYIPTRSIKMTSTCSNCIRSLTSFEWKVTGKNDSLDIPLDDDNVLSPLNSDVLVLAADVLDGKQSYEIKVTAKMKYWDSEGSTMFTLKHNTSPENGSCTLTPDSGESLTTIFTMLCEGWADDDNLKQPLLYWLVTGSDKYGDQTVNSRGIQNKLEVLLPTGNENDYILPVEIWVQDSMGIHTIALKKLVTVRPSQNAADNPEEFVKVSILPYLSNLAEKKDLNQLTALVVAASKLLSTSNKTDDGSKVDLIDSMVKETSKMDATSIETIDQILHAFHSVKKESKEDEIQFKARLNMQSSMKKIMTLSRSFASQFIGLESRSENSFMDLISSNIAFHLHQIGKNVTNTTVQNFESDSLNLLDGLYNVVLKTTILGEKAKVLKGDYLTTSLHRVDRSSLAAGSKTIGSCSVDYSLKFLHANLKELSEISECSALNPYTDVEGQHAITSLKFKDEELPGEFPLKENTESIQVDIGIPVQLQTTELFNHTYTISPDDLIVAKLENLTAPEEGWESSAIHIVIDLGEDMISTWVYAQLAFEQIPNEKRTFLKRKFTARSVESERTIILQGSDYVAAWDEKKSYYFGLDHDGNSNITLNVTTYVSTCRFWNVTESQWQGTGCRTSEKSTREIVVCSCNHLTSFGSSVKLSPNKLDFTYLKKLDVSENPVMLVTCIVVVFVYIVLAAIAFLKDRKEAEKDHVIPFIGSDDGFFMYEIRFKTGIYPWAGTTAKVGIQIQGTSCSTKTRVFSGENYFQRNAIDIFRISLDRSIGKIHKIIVWHDNSGSNPSWYLERVVIRSLVNGQKFFFYCNKWIGTDVEGSKLEYEFHAADVEEMQKFSTIFYDVLGRGFNDFHLWLSVFERPKFSIFSRLQRVTCLVTFVFSWMAVNAAWFQVAPDGKVDLYIGFKGFSYEELIIGALTALMVFPLNFLLLLLFRKSRQKDIVTKPLKIWKKPRRVMMEYMDIEDTVPLISDDNNEEVDLGYSTFKRTKNVRCLNFKFHDDDDDGDDVGADAYKRVDESDFYVAKEKDVLTLPHSFALPSNQNKGNMLSPEHRSNSISFTTKQDYSASYKKSLITKTYSDGSYGDLLAEVSREADEIKPDAIEQQISELFKDYESQERVKSHITSSDEMKSGVILSETTPGYFYESRLSAQIKKNEQLIVHLQIPDIIELDATTRWRLPYWCVYVGYICCFLISLLSIIVVITYGQQFGYELSKKWLKALAFGCLEDFFLTYPFVLVFVAAIIALFIKPLDLDQIDHNDFLACPSGPPQPTNMERARPPTGYVLENAIVDGNRRKKARAFAKDILFQIMLLWLVVSIVKIFPTNKNLYEVVEQERKSILPVFENQNYQKDYWLWFESTFTNYVYNRSHDTEWLLASNPVIQQTRVNFTTCSETYYSSSANINHCKTKKFFLASYLQEVFPNEIQFENPYGSKVQYGCLDNYPSQGNVWMLPKYQSSNFKSEMQRMTEAMKEKRWIDGNTRLLAHFFILYNQNTRQYAFFNLLVEAKGTGYSRSLLHLQFFPSQVDLDSLEIFGVFCLVLLTIIMAVFSFTIIKDFMKNVHSMKRFWSIHSILLILTTVSAIILQITSLRYLASLESSIGDGFIVDPSDIQITMRVRDVAEYLFGISIFLVIVRCIRLLKWWNIYKSMRKMFSLIRKSILLVAVFHLLVTITFANAGFLIFGCEIEGFRSYKESFLSTLLFRWWRPGGIELRETIHSNNFKMGMLWVIVYTAYWFILGINLFRAVLLNGWSDVPKAKKGSRILSFIWKTYLKPKSKKRKRVHFSVSDDTEKSHSSSYQNPTLTIKEEVGKEKEKEERPKIRPNFDLPPLPYSNFELGSNLISALADLDRMITAETWEEEALNQIAKKMNEMPKKPKKPFKKIEEVLV